MFLCLDRSLEIYRSKYFTIIAIFTEILGLNAFLPKYLCCLQKDFSEKGIKSTIFRSTII